MGACPTCGTETAPGARFCSECGEALAPGLGGTLQRILTFAFVDLVGSTDLAHDLDLERYDAVLTRFHRICAEAIAGYHGKVLQLYGDGALACFGLSDDGENAALAAVAAMLAVARTIPQDLPGVQVRVGVHTGTVFCRELGGGELAPPITGLDVNIAARVQGLAAPGGVVVTAATMDFLERIATVPAEDLGVVTLKGVREPLRVYALEDRPFGPARQEIEQLVEREQVLALLAGEAPASGGQGPRAFMLVGAPGIGKSAIVAELSRRLDNARRGVHLSARLNLRHSPLVPFAERLALALGYPRFPVDPAASSADLAARMARLVPGIAEDRIPIIADLLGLAEAQELMTRYTAAQLREMRIVLIVDLLAELMRREPVLLSFDDFHWADPDSRDVIDRLLSGGLPDTAALVLTCRADPESEAFAARHALTVLRVEPLSGAGARRLLDRGAAADLGEDEAERMIALAEGNPLFLRTLLDLFRRVGRERAAKALPPSIEATFQGVVNSFGTARDLVLLAAVIGRSFTEDELVWLAAGRGGDAALQLRDLARNGVVEPEAAGWRFGHILMQEAAYNMIPASRRRGLHRSFAEALAANDPVRAAAFPEIVADHAVASADAPLIAQACIAAGTSFLRRAVFERAVYYLETAAGTVDTGGEGPADPARRLEILTLLAAARVQRFGFSHPDTMEGYRVLEAAALERGAGGQERMLALYGLFAHRVISGEVRASREIVREMGRVADVREPQQQILRVVNTCAHAFYSGRFDACLAAGAELKGLYDRDRHGTLFLSVGADPLISVLTAEANVHGMRGRADAVRALTAEALEHLEAIGAALQKPWVLIFNAMALYGAGELAEAQDQLAEGVALADVQGAGFWSLVGRMWLCVMASERGHPEAAPAPLTALMAQADAVGIGISRPFLRSVQATDLLRAGRPDQAMTFARAACHEAGRTGQRLWAADIWRRRAEIHLALGQRAATETCARVALAYARHSGAAALERRCRETLPASERV